MTDALLSARAINRATLERQLLLRRHDLGVVDAIQRTVGLNAQDSNGPFLWLWARLNAPTISRLTASIEAGDVVRSTMMRATQHLATAADFRWLRPLHTPLFTRVQRNVFGRRTEGVDLAELTALTRTTLAGATMTRPELARVLEQRWPEHERMALAWSAQYLEPVVHPAPSGTWDYRGAIPFALAADHVGTLHPAPDPRELVRRYLAGYGPATTSDLRAWSGISGLREVVATMRGELTTFRDDDGRDVLDLPDAPRPDPDEPAPVRLLPAFDNLLLAYADRRRVMSDDVRRQVCVGDWIAATVLVDGEVAASWTLDHDDDTATLRVVPFRMLTAAERDEVEQEATSLLRFAASTAAVHEVRFAAVTDSG